jgi:hypothetical protein
MDEFNQAILKEIQKERESEITDKELIKNAIQIFITMGYETKIKLMKEGDVIRWHGERNLKLYDSKFEEQLKIETQKFYSHKANEWSQNFSCYEYIIKVSEHLRKEEENCDFYLQESSKPKIIGIIERELIENKAQVVA